MSLLLARLQHILSSPEGFLSLVRLVDPSVRLSFIWMSNLSVYNIVTWRLPKSFQPYKRSLFIELCLPFIVTLSKLVLDVFRPTICVLSPRTWSSWLSGYVSSSLWVGLYLPTAVHIWRQRRVLRCFIVIYLTHFGISVFLFVLSSCLFSLFSNLRPFVSCSSLIE